MQRPKRKDAGMSGKWMWVAAWCAGAVLAQGADITPGYTFSSGEQNVTHTKLNNAASGTINTSFYSGKSAAGTDPNTAWEILLRDTGNDQFKRSTLSAAFLNHGSLLSSRTSKTVPVGGDALLIADSEAGDAYKQIVWSNLLFNAVFFTGVATNEDRLVIYDWSTATVHSCSLSNLIMSAPTHTGISSTDFFLVVDAAGNLRKQAVTQAIMKAATNTFWSGSYSLVGDAGGQYRQTFATNMIAGLPSSVDTSMTGAERLQVLDGATLKWMAISNLLAVARTANVVSAGMSYATNLSAVGAWTNVVGLSNSITPRSINSRIKVTVHLQGVSTTDPSQWRVAFNGSGMVSGDSDGANRTECQAVMAVNHGNNDEMHSVSWVVLHQPGVVTSGSYMVQCFQNAGTTYLNRTSADSNAANHGRATSWLVLEEVYAP